MLIAHRCSLRVLLITTVLRSLSKRAMFRGIEEGDFLEIEDHVELRVLLDSLKHRGQVVSELRIVANSTSKTLSDQFSIGIGHLATALRLSADPIYPCSTVLSTRLLRASAPASGDRCPGWPRTPEYRPGTAGRPRSIRPSDGDLPLRTPIPIKADHEQLADVFAENARQRDRQLVPLAFHHEPDDPGGGCRFRR